MDQQSATADHPSHPRAARARRRTREKDARRQSILDAARAVFLEWGMSASTMDQIAQRAELSKGALYLHFSGKQELCLALLVDVSRSLVEVLKTADHPAAPALPAFERLERLIDAYYGFYLRRPDYFRLLFVVEHPSFKTSVSDALRTEWTELGKEALELLSGVIEAGIAQGSIQSCDPWTTAVALWTSLTGVIVLPVQEIRSGFVGDVSHEELVRSTLRIFWRGIQAAPSLDKQSSARRGKRDSKVEGSPSGR
ncbi:MAG: TetR/AcrR family transcriptional regulator [Deltaproteobacteria bacterium]|nr:TetR/AcrR family transcriptional regulator [Deltaproteobacteria bacterium]